jgi:glycosyltransferase involved in cell wall biosynthesis
VCEAIDSVLSQTYSDRELIVVDDGSTDNTRHVLSAYGDVLKYIHTCHGGPGAARNRGIEAAGGQYIAFLDSDDVWKPEKLMRQMEFFAAAPGESVCQTREIWFRRGVRVNPRKKHRMFSGWIFEKCLPLCIVSPSSVVIHRRVFNTVGVFDESLPACEDYDLWLRISPRYRIHLIDEELIIKRGGHQDQQSRTVKALDRYRIQALCTVMESGVLSEGQYERACEELARKCSVYASGCIKRGRKQEGAYYMQLPERYGKKALQISARPARCS